MKQFLLTLLDWIYKKKCYCCSSSKESVPICSTCYSELEFNSFMVNRIICNTNIYVAGIYNKNLQKMIRGIKYHNKKDLAYYLAKYLYEYFKQLDLDGNFEIIPVPLHKKRQKKRKYNHMELIAKEFCDMSGFSMNTELLTRIKDTKPQYRLSKSERMLNLLNAFSVDLAHYNNKPILIIDDISTSGATFESIINALHEVGISNITCLAISTPYN